MSGKSLHPLRMISTKELMASSTATQTTAFVTEC